MKFIFPYIGNVIIPTEELIFFRGVAQPPTRGDMRREWGDMRSYCEFSNHMSFNVRPYLMLWSAVNIESLRTRSRLTKPWQRGRVTFLFPCFFLEIPWFSSLTSPVFPQFHQCSKKDDDLRSSWFTNPSISQKCPIFPPFFQRFRVSGPFSPAQVGVGPPWAVPSGPPSRPLRPGFSWTCWNRIDLGLSR